MKAEIRWSNLENGPGTYDLYVDNVLQIEGETFGVVDKVRTSLLGFSQGAFMETDEIAHQIKVNLT